MSKDFKKEIRLAGTNPESIVDGPGFRFTVFVQGCPHRCPGCHNPSTWNKAGGKVTTVIDLFQQVASHSADHDGLTLSGGEPFEQADALSELARICRVFLPSIMCYTGYTWEELMDGIPNRPEWGRLLKHIDILVDGRFEQQNKTLDLRFRGSSNQRLIDVQASLRAGHVILSNV